MSTDEARNAIALSQAQTAERNVVTQGAPATPVAHAEPETAAAVVSAREVGRERGLAMLLRAGGVLGGACFLLSLPLQAVPPSTQTDILVDLLRKAGASFLLVTPIARLGVAGTLLALRGEWKYLGYAAATLSLLALAVGARIAA